MIYRITPVFKDYIWGGDKLKALWNKQTDMDIVAESWELSTHKDGMSSCNGRPLVELTGELPILIKLIDSKSNLSVQVHPDDDYAQANEGDNGKTEMWYIADCEPNAKLYIGFVRQLSREELLQRIADNTLEEVLQSFTVKAGESYFIPARTVHAIGAGITVCEIQQCSNVTYRLYDYGRVGADGKPRPLHTAKAAEVADLGVYTPPRFGDALARCKYFEVFEQTFEGSSVVPTSCDRFTAVTIIEGSGTIGGEPFVRGDTFYITAGSDEVDVVGDKVKLIRTVV